MVALESYETKKVEKELLRGLLPLIVLECIKNGDTHGYAIIKRIRRSYGTYFGPSTVYPLLKTLVEQGFVVCAWNIDGPRPVKTYALTDKGVAYIEVGRQWLKRL